MYDLLDEHTDVPVSVDLKRIDAALNMRRFYRMTIQCDLFEGTNLVREWGRIGFQGRMHVERYKDEGSAFAALVKLADQKLRRGYALAAEP